MTSEDTREAGQILEQKLFFQLRWSGEGHGGGGGGGGGRPLCMCVLSCWGLGALMSVWFMRQTRREVSVWFMRLLAGGRYSWTQKYAILRVRTVHVASACPHTYRTTARCYLLRGDGLILLLLIIRGGFWPCFHSLSKDAKVANRSSFFRREHDSPVHSALISWMIIMCLINLILCVLQWLCEIILHL